MRLRLDDLGPLLFGHLRQLNGTVLNEMGRVVPVGATHEHAQQLWGLHAYSISSEGRLSREANRAAEAAALRLFAGADCSGPFEIGFIPRRSAAGVSAPNSQQNAH